MDKYYSAVKRLLDKYGLNFKTGEEYEKFMSDLATIFEI